MRRIRPVLPEQGVHSPAVRLGGYPRFWQRDGHHWDGAEPVSPADAAELEERWRQVHVRIEWMASWRGRLDHALPQTLERQVRKQNIRAWVERKRT